MSSKEACKARSEAPLELGAKKSKVLEEAKKIEMFLKLTKIRKNAKSQSRGKNSSGFVKFDQLREREAC